MVLKWSRTLMALLGLCLLFCLVKVSNSNGVNKCQRGLLADIVFVLDSSASIHREQFNQQLQFVEDVVDKFPISKNQIQVGLLTFSYFVYPAFNLSTFDDKKSLKRGIKTAKYAGQGTFTAQAIAYARDKMFAESNGGRKNIPKIMIIITDGISENKTITGFEARLSKLKGIKIFVLGVGNGLDHIELQTMASNPPSKYILNVNGYGRLDTVIDRLSRKACIESKVSFTGPRTNDKRYLKKLHFTFVYDDVEFHGNSAYRIRKSIGLMVKKFDVSKAKMSFSLFSHIDTSAPQGRTVFLNTLLSKKSKSASLRRLLKSVYKNTVRRRRKEVVIAFISGKHLQNKRVFKELKRLSRISDLHIIQMSPNHYRVYKMEKDLCHVGRQCVHTVTTEKSLNNILVSIKQQICFPRHC